MSRFKHTDPLKAVWKQEYSTGKIFSDPPLGLDHVQEEIWRFLKTNGWSSKLTTQSIKNRTGEGSAICRALQRASLFLLAQHLYHFIQGDWKKRCKKIVRNLGEISMSFVKGKPQCSRAEESRNRRQLTCNGSCYLINVAALYFLSFLLCNSHKWSWSLSRWKGSSLDALEVSKSWEQDRMERLSKD